MKSYYRVMLGRKSVLAAEWFAGGFIGTEDGVEEAVSTAGWEFDNLRIGPVERGTGHFETSGTGGQVVLTAFADGEQVTTTLRRTRGTWRAGAPARRARATLASWRR